MLSPLLPDLGLNSVEGFWIPEQEQKQGQGQELEQDQKQDEGPEQEQKQEQDIVSVLLSDYGLNTLEGFWIPEQEQEQEPQQDQDLKQEQEQDQDLEQDVVGEWSWTEEKVDEDKKTVNEWMWKEDSPPSPPPSDNYLSWSYQGQTEGEAGWSYTEQERTGQGSCLEGGLVPHPTSPERYHTTALE